METRPHATASDAVPTPPEETERATRSHVTPAAPTEAVEGRRPQRNSCPNRSERRPCRRRRPLFRRMRPISGLSSRALGGPLAVGSSASRRWLSPSEASSLTVLGSPTRARHSRRPPPRPRAGRLRRRLRRRFRARQRTVSASQRPRTPWSRRRSASPGLRSRSQCRRARQRPLGRSGKLRGLVEGDQVRRSDRTTARVDGSRLAKAEPLAGAADRRSRRLHDGGAATGRQATRTRPSGRAPGRRRTAATACAATADAAAADPAADPAADAAAAGTAAAAEDRHDRGLISYDSRIRVRLIT